MDLFTHIEPHQSEGDTSRMFNLNSESLYEVRTGATIEAPSGLPEDFEVPSIYFTGYKHDAAVGIGSVVHLLNFEVDVRCGSPLKFESEVCCMKYITGGEILVIVLANGSVVFCNCSRVSPDSKVKTMDVLNECSPNSSIMEYERDNQALLLVITAPGGQAQVLELTGYMDLSNSADLSSAFEAFVNSATLICDVNLSSSIVVPYFPSGVLSLPSTSGIVSSLSFDEESFGKVSEEYDCPFSVISAALYGSNLIALADTGVLHFMDLFSGVWYKEFDLRLDDSFDDEILWFELLDHKDDIDLDEMKMFLVVNSPERGPELQIRTFPTNKVDYRIRASPAAQALSYSSEVDGSIIFIDPFAPRRDDEVVIRFINETHPEVRFKKLIACGRFDDAETFAAMYDLNIEQVHHARVLEMITVCGDDEKEVAELMKSVFKYFDLISDDNAVGDLCVLALLSVGSRQSIQKFLSYASERKITDPDTLATLTSRSYDFGTICALATDGDDFDVRIWKQLIKDENSVVPIFECAFALGHITSAEILWERYSGSILQNFTIENKFDEFLQSISEFVFSVPKLLKDVVEFIQRHFGPSYLMKAKNDECIYSRGLELINFTMKLIEGMEKVDPDNFPENSLLVSGLMERILDIVRTENVTCNGQSMVFKTLGLLGAASTEEKTPMGLLNVKKRNLEKMLHLKKSYNFTLSYDCFVQNDSRSICFRLLNQFKVAQKVPQGIKKVVIPYMKEARLKKDETLLEYIQAIVNRSRSFLASSSDSLCVAIADAISSPVLRCQAIIAITQKSTIPWCCEVRKAVKELSESKCIPLELRNKLKTECRREELGNIYLAMNLTLDILDQKMSTIDLLRLFKTLFYNARTGLENMMSYCLKVCELLEIIHDTSYDGDTIVAICMGQAATRFIAENDIEGFNEIFEMMKLTKIKRIAAKSIIDYANDYLNHTERILFDSRLAVCDAALMSCRNNLSDDDGYDYIYNIISNLRRIQEVYNVLIPIKYMFYIDKKPLEEYVTKFAKKEPKPQFMKVISFGSLLGFSRAECCGLYAAAFDNGIDAIYECLLFLGMREENLTEDDIKKSIIYCSDLFYFTHEWSRDDDVQDQAARDVLDKLLKLESSIENLFLIAAKLSLEKEMTTLSNLLDYYSLLKDMVECFGEHGGNGINQKIEEDIKIYSMTDQLGTVIPREHTTLYNPVDCIRVMAKVGYTIFTISTSLLDESSIIQDWRDVFMTFRASPYLELKARSMINMIPDIGSDVAYNGIQDTVFSFCRKTVVSDKVDLLLTVSAMFILTNESTKSLLMDLHIWAKQQQNSRAVYYISKLGQLAAIINGREHVKEMIVMAYRSSWWARCFHRNGIMVKNVDSQLSVHEDFLTHLGKPELYVMYCLNYGINSNEILLKYGFDLLKKYTKENDAVRAATMLSIAKEAFGSVNMDPGILCDRGFGYIDVLCPYSYEALDVLLFKMMDWNPNDQKINDYITVLKFLKGIDRRGDITTAEVKWYLDRSKKLQRDYSDSYQSDGMDIDDDFAALENRTISVNDVMPNGAHKKLPFHIFVDVKTFDQIVDVIIRNEIMINQVKLWLQMVTSMSESRRMSRTSLITMSITNRLRQIVSGNLSLNNIDIALIDELMSMITKRRAVLQTLFADVNKLPLCLSKIEAIELIKNCARQWLKRADIAVIEREQILDFVNIVGEQIKKLKTELVLDENGIPIIDTSLLKEPEELIQLIFSKYTDWNDVEDIEKKVNLAEYIAELNSIEFGDILKRIVESYFNGDDNVGYLQPALTGGGFNENFISGNVLLPPLPYKDADVVKLSYVMKKLNNKEGAMVVARKLLSNEDESPSRFLQKLKVACILVRYLDPSKFREYFNIDIANFSSQLTSVIVNFAIKMSNLNMSINDYYKADSAEELVNKLINSSGIAGKREAIQFATSVIIDRKVQDVKLIGKTLERLYKFGCNESLTLLLRYSTQLQNRNEITELAKFYAAAFDAGFENLKDKDAPDCRFRELVFFLLSSPIGKQGVFRKAVKMLQKEGMPVAARKLRAISDISNIEISEVKEMESCGKDLKQDEGNVILCLGATLAEVVNEETEVDLDEGME